MTYHFLQSARPRRRAGDPATAGSQSGSFAPAASEWNPLHSQRDGFCTVLISARLLPLTGLRRSFTRTRRRQAVRLSFLREQLGSSLIETTVLLPVLLLLLVGAVDYGRGFFAAMEVSSAAESGAMYGTTNPTDGAGIISMAQMDAKDVSGLNVSSSYGCECADGTGAVLNCATTLICTNNVIRYVDVSTSANYSPILPYPLIPSSFPLTGHSRMRMSPN